MWLPIPDYVGYEASSEGQVRTIIDRRYLKAGDVLKQSVMGNGYLKVQLGGLLRLTHRVICSTFNGQPPTSKHEVAHNNGNKHDNRAENLRWATRKENHADIKIHGTGNPPRGEVQGCSRLKNIEIPIIRRRLAAGDRVKDIAIDYGVSRQAISMIKIGRNWRHI